MSVSRLVVTATWTSSAVVQRDQGGAFSIAHFRFAAFQGVSTGSGGHRSQGKGSHRIAGFRGSGSSRNSARRDKLNGKRGEDRFRAASWCRSKRPRSNCSCRRRPCFANVCGTPPSTLQGRVIPVGYFNNEFFDEDFSGAYQRVPGGVRAVSTLRIPPLPEAGSARGSLPAS